MRGARRKLTPEVPELLKQAAVLEDDLRNAHQNLENLSEQIVAVNGKRYRVAFSRTLSEDELRRIEAMNFAGSDKTLADVQQVLEAALAILNMQNEVKLVVLSVREDASEDYRAEFRMDGSSDWLPVLEMDVDTENGCRDIIEDMRSSVSPEPDIEYRIRNVETNQIIDV